MESFIHYNVWIFIHFREGCVKVETVKKFLFFLTILIVIPTFFCGIYFLFDCLKNLQYLEGLTHGITFLFLSSQLFWLGIYSMVVLINIRGLQLIGLILLICLIPIDLFFIILWIP